MESWYGLFGLFGRLPYKILNMLGVGGQIGNGVAAETAELVHTSGRRVSEKGNYGVASQPFKQEWTEKGARTTGTTGYIHVFS